MEYRKLNTVEEFAIPSWSHVHYAVEFLNATLLFYKSGIIFLFSNWQSMDINLTRKII